MFAVLIATVATAFVALVSGVIIQRRRAPRSAPHLRHPARGVGAASAILLLASAGLVVAFATSGQPTVEPHNRWAIQPGAPALAPPELETLSLTPQ